MHFLIICKFKKDPINSNRENVDILIFRHSMAANSFFLSIDTESIKFRSSSQLSVIGCVYRLIIPEIDKHKKAEFVDSADQDATAQNKPPHLDPQWLPSWS